MMDIEQYLRDNKPEMPEEGQFMVETNARLRNVEGVKKCVNEDLRRGRMALIITLAVGLALGCLISLWVVFYPMPSIEVGQSAIARIMAGLKEWKDFLIALVAVCAITLGVVFMTRKNEAF
jgi:hypothetical protein